MAAKAENTAKEQQTAEQKQEAQQTGQKKDTVRFTLFKDNDKYKGDLFVGVNGKSYLVKRGVEVELPRGVYETIKNSQAQLAASINGRFGSLLSDLPLPDEFCLLD